MAAAMTLVVLAKSLITFVRSLVMTRLQARLDSRLTEGFFDHLLNYSGEKNHSELPKAGLSADYVARETRRALDDVQGKCKIYPGIDIDIPTEAGQKKTAPEDVHAATLAALNAGAQGVIFSRKYSEMRLANLVAGGRAIAESQLR